MPLPDDRPTQPLIIPQSASPAPALDPPTGPVFVAMPVRRPARPGVEPAAEPGASFQAAPPRRQPGVLPVNNTPRPAPRPKPVVEPPAVETKAATVDEAEAAGGVLLEAIGLRREVGKGKVILNDVSLVARPREFVAVVGGSGAGKSTLLGALSGFRPATSGQVLLDGVPLYQHFDTLRSRIGYVPQDDVIHKELTVERALAYAAELRLPAEWTPAQREARLDEVLSELGLQEHRKTVVANLSGGQRKRVSIGVELLTKPRLFFLDEPTSGLDPGMEHHMMQLLRQLADQGRTVLLITHATRNIALCDKVLFLVRGGRVAFYGSPEDALRYFGVKEIDEIYSLLEEGQSPESCEAAYRASNFYRQEIDERLVHRDGAVQQLPAARTTDPAQERRESWRQFTILTRRYADIVLHDRKNLIILLAQAPVIALLLWALFSGNVFQQPTDEWLLFPRFPNQVFQLSSNAGFQTCASFKLAPTCTWSQVATKAMDNQRDQGNQGAQGRQPANSAAPTELVFYKGRDCSTVVQRGPSATCAQDATGGNGNAGKAAQLIFILAATAVWLGTLNAIREVSKEDAIYRRERMLNLRVLPYIASKFTVLLALVLVQATLLFAFAALHIGFPGGGAIGIWLSLVLGGTAATALALTVSSAVSNPDRAVFAAPLIMLPQILLAGLLVPVSGLGIAQPLAALVTSRWTYEAAGRASGVVDTAAFAPSFQYRMALNGTALVSWLWLLGLTVACALAATALQKRKDRR